MFFEKINLSDFNILQQSDLPITKDLFFGSGKLKDDKNNALLTSAMSSYSPQRDLSARYSNHKQPIRLVFTL